VRYTAIPVLPARRAPRAQTSLGSRNDATKDLIQEDFIVSADKHIVVAGAGLGGLTFALSAVKQGFRVTVLEQAKKLGEVGAGVQTSANGTRILDQLGLTPALDAVAFRPERGEMRHFSTGETLVSRDLGRSSVERFGFPYYHLHRADFHAVLANALEAQYPGTVRLGHKVTAFDQHEHGVRVHLDGAPPVDGDVLVGCDGIHSQIRAALFGQADPRFTGCIAWRATIPTSDLPAGHVRPVASNWLGRGGHFVHYYLRRGELVNCVGLVERDEWVAESWSAEGDPAQFAADFTGWHEDLQVLIRATKRCFRWGLFDRDPMPRWGQGRVTLLGDACHPMLPFMAQGAVMSIEDGFVLARCLWESYRASDQPHAGLARYEALRRDRTAEVQGLSRSNMDLFHNVDSATPERLSGVRSAHEWLYGYDATSLDYAL
jgi:salicylate hydroxylase